MGYERSKFGDGSTAGSGNVTSTVHNHYGPRSTGKSVGVSNSDTLVRELVVDLDGSILTAEEFALMAPQFPAGAKIEDAVLEVEEAFVLGGTSPVVEVGTSGSEATNGVTLTEAQLEAVGVYDVTSAVEGTWAAGGLAAATEVGVVMGGTSPTSTTAGKARLVVRYFKV